MDLLVGASTPAASSASVKLAAVAAVAAVVAELEPEHRSAFG